MYGLSAEFDVTAFVGHELDWIVFARYTIHLRFDDDNVSISAENWVEYRLAAGGEMRRDVPPTSDSSLMSLIGRRVVAAERTPTGGLRIHFDGEGELRVDDDSPQYECFSVTTPAGTVYV